MKYKMYKAKKSWKIAPVLATGLLGGIIASEQNISADTVSASSVNSGTISNSDSTSASASIHSSTVALHSSQRSQNVVSSSLSASSTSIRSTTNNEPVNFYATSSSAKNTSKTETDQKPSIVTNSSSSYNYVSVKTHSNSLSQQMSQGIQDHQSVDSQAASHVGLNDNGQKIAQAAGLDINNLNENEINALNHATYTDQSYNGQMTYKEYRQFAQDVVDEKKQYAIPQFDSNKIENLPAATTEDAKTGKVEALDIWDSWPVVKAETGVPVNYHGYQLVVGMMGSHDDWDDGHLYLLYSKYCDDNFNDWKVAGPIFGYNASDQYQQWSGSATVNPDGSIQLYYTFDDHTDGNNDQQLATATIDLNYGPDGVTIKDVRNNKVLFKGDGYYYQTYNQWKNGSDSSADDYCLRDPHVIEINGKRYLVFEGNTGTYNYQSPDQVYNLNNYGGSSIGEDVQDMFKIVNNPTVYKQSALANACIGLMELGGNLEDPTISKLYAPIVSTPLISDEIERPVIVPIDGKYYLFVDTRLNRGIMNEQNDEANSKIGDNVGMLGFVADSIDGNYVPLNGDGTVLTASTSSKSRTSEYSWYAVPMPNKQGDNSRYILITAYMSNRDEAAGPGKNATWGPSFVVKINPDGTTEVLDSSVTNQQGIWHEPCHLSEVFQNYPNTDSVQQSNNNQYNLSQNNKNVIEFKPSTNETNNHFTQVLGQNGKNITESQSLSGKHLDQTLNQSGGNAKKLESLSSERLNKVSNVNCKNVARSQSSLKKMSNHFTQMAHSSDVSEKTSNSNLDKSESDLQEVSISYISGETTSINIKRSNKMDQQGLPQTGETRNAQRSGIIGLACAGLAAAIAGFGLGYKHKH